MTLSRSGQRVGTLSDLRVLDLSTFLSGPHCTQTLGDLGAEIIKIESPEGDLTRKLPPHFVGSDSAYFLSTNRNKKSVVVDLKDSAGQALLNRLALTCDIVVENFRPGVAQRLGLDYNHLVRDHPSVIWCSITGFGQDGPYRDLAAYDMVIQAMSGIMSLTGEVGRPGVRAGIPLSDLVGGLYAAIGILAALHERKRSGRGQYIDISLLDCVTAMLSYQGVYHLVSGDVPGRQGRGHDSIPTYRTFTASDGEDVTITANTERMWRALCEVVERPDLAQDPRFASLDVRHKNREELWEILESRLRTRSAAEWAKRLRAADVPAAVVSSVDQTLQDPHVLGRGMVLTLAASDGRSVRVLGNPIQLSETESTPHRYPPRLGEDTRSVLSEVLALSDAEIDRLTGAGVVAAV